MTSCCKKPVTYAEVPVSPNFLSSDLHTPEHFGRTTQANIGKHRVAHPGPSDSGCIPRSAAKHISAPYLGAPSPELCEDVLNRIVAGKKGTHIPAPQNAGADMNRIVKDKLEQSSDLPSDARRLHEIRPSSVTSQSPQPECILRQCSNLSLPLKPYKNYIKHWHPEKQFWYLKEKTPTEPWVAPNWPVGDPNSYTFKRSDRPIEGIPLLEKLEIERIERYLPGEIYKAQTPKAEIEDLTKTADCSKIWKPKDPTFCEHYKPGDEIAKRPKLLDEVLRGEDDYKRQQDSYSKYEATREGKKMSEAVCRPESLRRDVRHDVVTSYVCKRTGKDPCRVNEKDVYIPRGIIKKLNLKVVDTKTDDVCRGGIGNSDKRGGDESRLAAAAEATKKCNAENGVELLEECPPCWADSPPKRIEFSRTSTDC